MCVACLEYTKDRLNVNEFQSALKETTMEDRAHAAEVEELLRRYSGQPDELKRQLEALAQKGR